MSSSYTEKDQKIFEQAIIFLVTSINKFCNNKKPVILHSLRVGFRLIDEKQLHEVVIAGFLHDLIEDSNIYADDTKKEFGKKVADLVIANTFDKSIEDYKERWTQAISRLLKSGKPAMMIKVADNLDNLPYYWQISDKDTKKRVFWKHQFTISRFGPILKNEKMFQEYKLLFENLCDGLGE